MKALNFLLILVFTSIICGLIFWLWQRQPKGTSQDKPQATSIAAENKQKEPDSAILLISPKNSDILDTNSVKFSGKANKDNKIILISNSISDIASVKNDGTFEITENLNNGLNLINIISTDQNFKETKRQSLTLYVLTSNSKDKNVTAGTVSKIFQNTLTVTTLSGDETVEKAANTSTTISGSAPPTKNKDSDIRIGDYIVALGTKTKDTNLTPSSIQIIRDNKPQITKTYTAVKLASATKLKIFSGYNLLDNKLIEFKLDKINVFNNDKASDEKAITKDKRAVVFYTPTSSDNIVSLVYILP